jgi:hypothetical protein
MAVTSHGLRTNELVDEWSKISSLLLLLKLRVLMLIIGKLVKLSSRSYEMSEKNTSLIIVEVLYIQHVQIFAILIPKVRFYSF